MKRTSRILAALTACCLTGAIAGLLIANPLTVKAASAAEPTPHTGHLHAEPGGGFFCHCGSSPNCNPCGG